MEEGDKAKNFSQDKEVKTLDNYDVSNHTEQVIGEYNGN
tara:strand:- start:250 stop:366 length:117 start_codon:yes stop_codon:yes gene_type:complete